MDTYIMYELDYDGDVVIVTAEMWNKATNRTPFSQQLLLQSHVRMRRCLLTLYLDTRGTLTGGVEYNQHCR